MEQSFLLKYHGGFSLTEVEHMTGEERSWWLNRIIKERKREREESTGTAAKGALPAPGAGRLG